MQQSAARVWPRWKKKILGDGDIADRRNRKIFFSAVV